MSACAELVEKQDGRSSLCDLDHYTLIVENAEEVANFHREVLGFTLLEVRPLNTGTASIGEYDMLNYILAFPDHSQRTMVITEGLTDESYFRRHLRERGPGIHHIAYRVDDIEAAMMAMQSAGGRFLSEAPITDPVSKLRQVFLTVPGAGYTVELIERKPREVGTSVFEENNMIELAHSMDSTVPVQTSGQAHKAPVQIATFDFETPPHRVKELLCDRNRLAEWTGHKTLRRFESTWMEVRLSKDVEVLQHVDGDWVSYTWMEASGPSVFRFELTRREGGGTRVTFRPSAELSPESWKRQKGTLEAEFTLFRSLLGEVVYPVELSRARERVDLFAAEVVGR